MRKTFNTNGYCDPGLHYMVDLSGRLEEIKSMVDARKYFTINRARQYGKTTILTALSDFLKDDYEVYSIDFQTFSHADFESEQSFAAVFSERILECAGKIPEEEERQLKQYASGTAHRGTLSTLFRSISRLCEKSEKRIVLLIDEVDTATNNQVFIDFLAQLRAYYLNKNRTAAFQSVILAGVGLS